MNKKESDNNIDDEDVDNNIDDDIDRDVGCFNPNPNLENIDKKHVAMCGFGIIIIGLALFLVSGGFDEPDLVGDDPKITFAQELMKNAVPYAGPCDFYDSKHDTNVGKPVKFSQATVISNGGTYITFHGGNPQKYGYLILDTNNLNVDPKDIKPGAKFTIYGIYDGMKAHPNEGINSAVPTFSNGIVENVA
jgi:hypothetical protein